MNRSGSPSRCSSTCARTTSSVAKLVIRATGMLASSASARRSRLVELDGQEAAPVDRLGDGLDPAAEAGRHPAGEDDHRDLPLAQRGSPRLDGPLEARVARRGEGGQIRRLRWLDQAGDDVAVAVRLPSERPARSALELLGGEAMRCRISRASGSTSSRIIASPRAREATPSTGRDARPPRSRLPRSDRRE